jgi:hypothetical protein
MGVTRDCSFKQTAATGRGTIMRRSITRSGRLVACR